jgi:hypothetical protein
MSGTLVLAVTIAPARAQSRNQAVVGRRHVAAQPMLPLGGQQAFGVLQVLDAQRQAVQRPQGSPRITWRLGRPRRAARAIEVGRGDALTAGLSASMRAMQASISSTGDSGAAPISARSSSAEWCNRSSLLIASVHRHARMRRNERAHQPAARH